MKFIVSVPAIERNRRAVNTHPAGRESVYQGITDKTVSQIGVDFFVRTRRQTGRRVVLCGGFAGVVRAKKMRQDGGVEFISAS